MCGLGIVGFSSESEMEKNFLQNVDAASDATKVLAGIVFHKMASAWSGTSLSSIEYKLRFPSTLRSTGRRFSLSPVNAHSHWMTQYMFPVFQTVGPRTRGSTQGGPPGRATT